MAQPQTEQLHALFLTASEILTTQDLAKQASAKQNSASEASKYNTPMTPQETEVTLAV
jgi:hypothetical protein